MTTFTTAAEVAGAALGSAGTGPRTHPAEHEALGVAINALEAAIAGYGNIVTHNAAEFDVAGAAAAAQAAAIAASQPVDADLTSIAALTTTAFGRAFLTFANTAAVLSALSLDADLATFAVPASTTISTFGASLVDDANAAAAIATLGLDADIATLALPASTTISTFGASLVDDAAASDARTTLGLGTMATETATAYGLLAGRAGGQTINGGTADTDDLTFLATAHGTPATGSDIIFKSGTTQLMVHRKSGWTYHGPVASGFPQYEVQAPGIEFNNSGQGAVYSSDSGLGASFVGTETHASGATVNMRRMRGTLTSPTALQSGDVIGGLRVGSIGATYATDCAQIYFKTTEIHSASASGTKFEVYTTPNTTNTKTLGLTIGQDQSLTVANNLVIQDGGTATYTAAPSTLAQFGPSITYTLNFASAAMGTICDFSSTIEFQQTALAFGMGQVFNHNATWKNKNASTANLKALLAFIDAPVIQADNATITAGASVSFSSSPTYNIINAGVQSGGTHSAFKSNFVVNTGATVTSRTGVLVAEATGTGTLTNQFGIDIGALAFAGTSNVGIRCTPAIVYPPTVCTCTSNAATVTVNLAHAKVTNSSAATCTITLNTTGALDGQELLVRYFDSTAASQTVTFTNSETGKAGAPPASLGSTSIPSTYRFIYNSGTSKWTYTGN